MKVTELSSFISPMIASIFNSPQVSKVSGLLTDHSYHLSYSHSVQPTSPSGGSHSRKPLLSWSPQTSVQVLFLVTEPPVQVNPDSTMQALEQPSPSISLPSSHPSKVSLLPSPHTAPQSDLISIVEYGHSYPSSTFQSELQPSPGRVLPSSQLPGSLSTTPSPHTFCQVSAESSEPPVQE